jgi:hypothetical protein
MGEVISLYDPIVEIKEVAKPKQSRSFKLAEAAADTLPSAPLVYYIFSFPLPFCTLSPGVHVNEKYLRNQFPIQRESNVVATRLSDYASLIILNPLSEETQEIEKKMEGIE